MTPEPFWDWAVASYAREGVAEACLGLQDNHGHNVPLLLWGAWAGVHGAVIDSALAIRAADLARDWTEVAILPLRTVRRRLKTAVAESDEALRLALREQVKAAELQAEKVLMAQLEALVAGGERLPVATGPIALAEGVLAVARAWRSDSPPEVLAGLIQALTKGEFLGYNG